jgi:transposase InsO family protein
MLEKLPFGVEVVRTDNGTEFGSQFHYHVLDAGVGHVYIMPATPRLNGDVERSHRSSTGCSKGRDRRHRTVQRPAPGVGELLQLRPSSWGLGGQTPYERLRQKTARPV